MAVKGDLLEKAVIALLKLNAHQSSELQALLEEMVPPPKVEDEPKAKMHER